MVAKALSNAIDALESNVEVSFTTLRAVAEAASNNRTAIYEAAATVLGELATSSEAAVDQIRQMGSSTQPHVRHNALPVS